VQSRPTRRTVMQLIAGQALATSVGAAQLARVQNNAPNVVFVLADDVGYGDFGCLGNPYIKTPNIDSMHARGFSHSGRTRIGFPGVS
jgi:Sulfatase